MNLVDTIHSMPVCHQQLADGVVLRYREAGSKTPGAPVLVLLHGIGSGSASWVRQLLAADGGEQRVLAWDAPGYADSSPVLADEPSAADYAARFWLWMDALGVDTLQLVGHSLGCIMAAGAAHAQPARVQRLILLAPAQGYGTGTPEVRAKMYEDRVGMFARLGAAGMAAQRAPALLTPNASADDLALATNMMASLNPVGYSKATHLLANAVIANGLANVTCPITVACDTITPPAACKSLADKLQAPYVDLANAGHLCAVQAWQQLNQLLHLGLI
jgi:pimeloyl-ACP methyl ester carboxylesterase